MSRQAKESAKAIEVEEVEEEDGDCLVKGESLEPIRVVKRELTRPDGTKLTVDVPVYPPFRLPDRPGNRLPNRPTNRRSGNSKNSPEKAEK